MTQNDIQSAKLSNGEPLQVHTHLFINNTFVPGHGPLFENINPVNEQVICKVQSANEQDVDAAVEAATKAFKKVWRKEAAAQRGRYLYKLADLMERDKIELAKLEVLDSGKPFMVARDADVADSIACFRYFAGWADKIQGDIINSTYDKTCCTVLSPLGVVGAICPWNYTIMMPTWKLAPALAAGNTVVLKTSEVTPLAMLKVAALMVEAGFPAGVVNIITGEGHVTGSYLSSHPGIQKLAFTGSTHTGRHIMEKAVKSNIKKVQLQLSGKSSQIVCADADLQNAAVQVCVGAFINNGQSCCAGSRILVQEEVLDEFMALFMHQVSMVYAGDPFEDNVALGPLINKAQFEKVLRYIESGVEEGATLVQGGQRQGDTGYFIEPTVFCNCTLNMRIMREEIFGPVAGIMSFKTLDEAIEMANDTDYGLAGGVYTTNLETAINVSESLEAGTVWVNCYEVFDQSTPFGGFKHSGFGKDLGLESLREYSNLKTVKIQRTSWAKAPALPKNKL
ncbi:hypothetical protein [Absidia glauca]|uniref:Aldehyde dehydrogenase domain-containing protein n=1 Tax=Absidia glauca TaxID=4829 RepID=A0A168PI30_ABSGL|nr:hypothetical protein [Absidia glauca]